MTFEFELKNEKKNLIIELRVRYLLLINIELINRNSIDHYILLIFILIVMFYNIQYLFEILFFSL